MYIRHVDEEEQKIEMWLWPEPAKYPEVEKGMSFLLKGLLMHLDIISKLPKDEAMCALKIIAHHMILSVKESRGDPPSQAS